MYSKRCVLLFCVFREILVGFSCTGHFVIVQILFNLYYIQTQCMFYVIKQAYSWFKKHLFWLSEMFFLHRRAIETRIVKLNIRK